MLRGVFLESAPLVVLGELREDPQCVGKIGAVATRDVDRRHVAWFGIGYLPPEGQRVAGDVLEIVVPKDARQPSEETDMDNEKLLDRIHALEVAQATQSATVAGMEATQGAVQAGNMATTTAMTTGTMTTMAAGSVALIVGIFLGLVFRR